MTEEEKKAARLTLQKETIKILSSVFDDGEGLDAAIQKSPTCTSRLADAAGVRTTCVEHDKALRAFVDQMVK